MDFTVQDHGSVVILVAISDEAATWVEEHLPEDRLTWGASGTVVELRYVSDIVTAMVRDGLRGVAS